MNVSSILRLSEDIRGLYLKTGIKSLENVYSSINHSVKIQRVAESTGIDLNLLMRIKGRDAHMANALIILRELNLFYNRNLAEPDKSKIVANFFNDKVLLNRSSDPIESIKRIEVVDRIAALSYLFALPAISVDESTPKAITDILEANEHILRYISSSTFIRKVRPVDPNLIIELFAEDAVSESDGKSNSENSYGNKPVKRVDLDPRRRELIFKYVYNATRERIVGVLGGTVTPSSGNISAEMEEVLNNIRNLISNSDLLANPSKLMSQAKIPEEYKTAGYLGNLVTTAHRVANEVLISMSSIKEEDIPEMAKRAAELIISSIGDALGFMKMNIVDKSPKPDDYYSTVRDEDAGQHASQRELEAPVEDRVMTEISVILGVSEALHYMINDV